MTQQKDFFSTKNSVNKITPEDYNQTNDYLKSIKAISRTSYQSIYIINYQHKGFEYVSENPLFLCGNTAEEVKKMGYEFYLKYVTKEDLDLLLKINTIGFDFYENISPEDRQEYVISYDFHLKNHEDRIFLINHKLTPLFLNSEGRIWKALCVVSLSFEKESGNIQIYKNGGNKIQNYDLVNDCWKDSKGIKLSKREKEVIELSSRGYTINEIADKIFVSPDTVKFHRRKLFNKLGVTNISEAICCAMTQKLF